MMCLSAASVCVCMRVRTLKKCSSSSVRASERMPSLIYILWNGCRVCEIRRCSDGGVQMHQEKPSAWHTHTHTRYSTLLSAHSYLHATCASSAVLCQCAYARARVCVFNKIIIIIIFEDGDCEDDCNDADADDGTDFCASYGSPGYSLWLTQTDEATLFACARAFAVIA